MVFFWKYVIRNTGYVILILVLLITPVYAASPSPTPHPCSLDTSIAVNKIVLNDYENKYGPCPAGLQEFEDMVGNIISVFVGLGFIVMLVMLVTAGFKYLTSGGEPKAIQAAHAVTTWAILGILFMAIAWLILQLVAAFTGIDVTIFDIKALCGGSSKFPFCTP